MVSLVSNIDCESEQILSSEGHHFSGDDTRLLLQPVIGERSKRFAYIGTVLPSAVLLISTISLACFIVVLVVFSPRFQVRQCEAYFLTIYAHVIYWVFSFIFDFYLRRKHTESRIEGYLEFYNNIIKHARAPFYITTLWNTIMLTLTGVFHQLYGEMEDRCNGNLLDPLHYTSALILVELLAVSIVLILYIVKIQKFNKQKAVPDALRDEWMASFIRDSYSGGEVGCRERDNHISDLLEKQADLLRYLKEQNSRLVQKVMILSLQLQEKHKASIT